MKYTIQAVCKKLNLSVHTVRHYCDSGLVPNLERDAHGNRIFDDQSVNWLQAAVFLRASGLSVAEVRHYVSLCQEGEDTIQQRYQILLPLQEKTETEQKMLQRRLDCIRQKTAHCRDIMNGLCDDDCNPLNWGNPD